MERTPSHQVDTSWFSPTTVASEMEVSRKKEDSSVHLEDDLPLHPAGWGPYDRDAVLIIIGVVGDGVGGTLTSGGVRTEEEKSDT